MPSDADAKVKSWDEGYAFPTATATATATAWSTGDPNSVTGASHQAGGAAAGVSLGSYVGVDAGLTAYKYEHNNAKLQLGFGLDTGAGIKDQSLQLKVLGTGISLGDTTGFSFFGSKLEGKNFFSMFK